jgi:hypothetical protein
MDAKIDPEWLTEQGFVPAGLFFEKTLASVTEFPVTLAVFLDGTWRLTQYDPDGNVHEVFPGTVISAPEEILGLLRLLSVQ